MPLAVRALLYIWQGVPVHGWPIVSLPKNLEGQGSSLDVLPTDPLVELDEDYLNFRWREAT